MNAILGEEFKGVESATISMQTQPISISDAKNPENPSNIELSSDPGPGSRTSSTQR